MLKFEGKCTSSILCDPNTNHTIELKDYWGVRAFLAAIHLQAVHNSSSKLLVCWTAEVTASAMLGKHVVYTLSLKHCPLKFPVELLEKHLPAKQRQIICKQNSWLKHAHIFSWRLWLAMLGVWQGRPRLRETLVHAYLQGVDLRRRWQDC